jgi:hypothetical protein
LKRFGIETLRKITAKLLSVSRGGFLKRFGIETLQKITSRLLRVSRGRFLKRFGIKTLQEIHLDASLQNFFIKTRAPNTNHKLLIRDA